MRAYSLRFLGASHTSTRLDPLGELSTRGPVVRTSLTSSQLIKAGLHIRTKLLTRLIALLQKSERLADHFAGSLVQPALDLLVYERSSSGVNETFMQIFPLNRG